MLNTKQIISMLEEFEGEEGEFATILDGVVKTGLRMQRNSDELVDECQRLFKKHDSVFQFIASDIDLNFFVKIVNGATTYDQGIYQKQDVPVTTIIFPKEIILQVVKQEMNIESLYNKGIIKLKGSLSNLMRLRVLGKYYVKYMDNLFATR